MLKLGENTNFNIKELLKDSKTKYRILFHSEYDYGYFEYEDFLSKMRGAERAKDEENYKEGINEMLEKLDIPYRIRKVEDWHSGGGWPFCEIETTKPMTFKKIIKFLEEEGFGGCEEDAIETLSNGADNTINVLEIVGD